mgnify:FL=1
MTFKKDYINYLLHTVVNSPQSGFRENYRLSKLVDSIMAIDDAMKVTYLVGKTAGLDMLFKYLLYISDKIDKSQVTIFNLKDNFDYDRMNLAKICAKIDVYKSENVQEVIKSISEEDTSAEKTAENIKIETSEDEQQSNVVEIDSLDDQGDQQDDEDTGLTLIENNESNQGEAEVFEIESISDSVENPEEVTEEKSGKVTASDENDQDEYEDLSAEDTETDASDSGEDSEMIESVSDEDNSEEELITENLPEIEIEVHKPISSNTEGQTHVKEEAITNEAYYKFETKFFEEVKILEKLLASVSKDCRADDSGKLSERCLQCTTEIIGITSELSNLSRQLSFDLIADVFLTMNIFFTKSISQPELLTAERIKLLDSSLALVNSLIKGEDYLNYDTIVDRMEKLKSDITAQPEKVSPPQVKDEADKQKQTGIDVSSVEAADETAEETVQETVNEEAPPEEPKLFPQKPQLKQSQLDSANFKLKYLIKEFEKSFNSIGGLKGEYSKFDALEKVSELNNALRMIAKISAAIKHNDLLKLAEVTYVFLKYVKDYRMEMQEPEIQQIIKYIIFTFKMLLTDRKPEDFNVLVRHLNNPVKIFADS